MTATIELEGQQFMLLNGGPLFKFTEAISLFVSLQNPGRSGLLLEQAHGRMVVNLRNAAG